MSLTWNLAQLIAQFRKDTGRSQTTDISDDAVTNIINDYYVNYFSSDAKVDEFNKFFTQALSATDTGVYALAQEVDRLDDPVTINGKPIVFYRDRELFFGEHIYNHRHFLNFSGSRTTGLHGQFEDEQFVTSPGLAIGTSNTARVLHAAFSYRINELSYSKSTSEVALTGSTIPQNKYGAWSFKIDTDGDITVASATDNATGYDTPRQAIEGLASSDSASAYMGYVTAISTDSGGFVPDTTLLSDSAVTDTYTNGRFENRGEPISAQIFGQDLYVKPRPNDIYQLKAIQIADRPTELTGTDELADPKHGPAVSRGAAIFFLGSRDPQRIIDLSTTTKHIFTSIRSDKIKRLLGQVIQRRS